MELFRTGDSHALADSARFSAQMDTARAAGASKVIAYDLSVLGNAGLDSLEKWFSRNSSLATESFIKFRENRRSSKQRTTGNTPMYTDPRHKEIRYYKLNGAIVKSSE